MELEFDKEIDAILRKARGGDGAAVTAVSSPHLDADTIAAFVENALPERAKLSYTEHLADCFRCRKLLSNSILMMNETAASAATVEAADAVAAIDTEPWYRGLFRTTNLAFTMGALVIALSGALAFLILQNRNSSDTTVSQISDTEMQKGGPSAGIDVPPLNSNLMAAANTAANVSDSTASGAAKSQSQISESDRSKSGPADERDFKQSEGLSVGKLESGKDVETTDSAMAAGEQKPAGVAPPPPAPVASKPKVMLDGVTAETVEKERKDEDMLLAKKKSVDEYRGQRDLPAAPSKSGPVRSGPLQNQSNQISSNITDMTVTRLVGGKRFENRNGAWYDSVYRGQATTNVRRSTEEFKKLDGGLRNIANTLGGTGVVVWKEKAYRIQ